MQNALWSLFMRAWSTTDLYLNLWRLSDSEFDTLNSSLFFSLKSLLWSLWNNQMWVVTYVVEKDRILSHVLGQFVYCHLDLSDVQCVEHLCTCYSTNTKPVHVLSEWHIFLSATVDLKLLRQISIIRLLLKKRHT